MVATNSFRHPVHVRALLICVLLIPAVDSKPETFSFLRRKRWFPFPSSSKSSMTTAPTAATVANVASEGTDRPRPGSLTNSQMSHMTLRPASDQQSKAAASTMELREIQDLSPVLAAATNASSPSIQLAINTDSNHETNGHDQQKSTGMDVNSTSTTTTSFLGGAIVTLLKNPRVIAKWGMAGLQVAILFFLGTTVWQAAQDVLHEFEEQTSNHNNNNAHNSNGGGPPIFKSNIVTQVLQQMDQQQPATDHFALHRIAQRLQFVTGWQLFDDTDKAKPSIYKFLTSLTRNEYNILDQCLYIPPTNEDPRIAWSKIHGISDIQQAIVDRLHAMNFCPQHNPYAPILLDNHAGLLLYGPPGCGKTMLLQAICATMRAPCLIVTPSVLLKKYVGETNGLIRSLFQLGQKLGGCVICLDELDGLFRERRHDEHDTSRELKTEFMQWWDGLKNDQSRMLIVGATNRPFDVDAAILRRMSQSHFVGLPMGPARLVILQKILSQLPTSPDINLTDIVQSTEGFAPSDLVQLVRTAAQQGPLRDGRGNHSNFRPLTQQDLTFARQQVGPTPLSNDYRNALIQFHQQRHHQHSQQQQHSQHQQQQQQQQQVAVQSTPWGNFYHAGTFSVDDLDDDESDNNSSSNNDDGVDDVEEGWGFDEQEAEINYSEEEDL